MKRSIFFLLLLPLLAPRASGETLSTTDGSQQNQKGEETAKKEAVLIRGVCQIVQSPKNPFAGPCVSLSLSLVDESSGKEYLRTRTDQDGNFGFGLVEGAGGNYRIESGSRFYEVLYPKKALHGGELISLHLRQK